MRIKLNAFFILFLFASYFAGWLQQSLILFAGVLLHELGHVFTAKKMRIQVFEIELLPYGGVARMEELSKFGGAAEAIVSAAGPVTSLLVAGACYLCRNFSGLMELGYRYNLVICIFNLLPIIPLDGGKIARNLLIFFMGYRQATRILVLAGRAAAFILLGYNIYMLATGSRSAALIIAAVFIYIGTVKEEKFSSYYYLFTGNSTKNMLITRGHIRKRFIKAREDARISSVVNRFSPVTLCYVQVVDASGAIKRIISEDEIMKGFLKYGYDGRIRQIINI
ncbi:MAG TPA: M50 family metallopeptidase [Clostridia bacterium]|nr:M50 family metallopeptidase [Clostridia bacterium]